MRADFSEWLSLIRRLRRRYTQARLNEALVQAGRSVGVAMESLVLPIPPPPRRPLNRVYPRTGGGLSKFKTLKQQRFFFYALSTGLIKVPYRRTNALYRSLTSTVEYKNKTLLIYVGTNSRVAVYVIGFPRQPGLAYPKGSNQQSFYHKQTGHKSLPGRIKDKQSDLIRLFITELQKQLLVER